MGNVKHNMTKTLFACLMSLVLAMGLMPGIAFADEGYPDVNERVYVGPETQTTVDVGNVTVDGDGMSFNYGVFVHAKKDVDATGNVHGDVKLTGTDVDSCSVVVAESDSPGTTATANVYGDVTSDIYAKTDGDLAAFGVDTNAAHQNTNAIAYVDGNVTVTVTKADELKATLDAYGVMQKSPSETEGAPALSQVTVNGDVTAELVNASGALGNDAVGVAVNAYYIGGTSTTVTGGVTAKGGGATGIYAQAVASAEKAAGAVITVGQGGVTAESSAELGSAYCIEFDNISSTITMRIGGDVTAKANDPDAEVGISALGKTGVTDILIDGTLAARFAGVQSLMESGQLDLAVWKVDSNMVAAKLDKQTQQVVEDEAAEAAINYIIRVEQPQEGNILKLVGTTVKEAEMVDGTRSYDLANMGQKVYLDVEEGWVITAAFNGQGEKVALDKDDQGWFVIVPNGGGVYLSANVAKVQPAPEPTPSPDSGNAAGSLPATGDSPIAFTTLVLTSIASLALALFAASRLRRRPER